MTALARRIKRNADNCRTGNAYQAVAGEREAVAEESSLAAGLRVTRCVIGAAGNAMGMDVVCIMRRDGTGRISASRQRRKQHSGEHGQKNQNAAYPSHLAANASPENRFQPERSERFSGSDPLAQLRSPERRDIHA
jgi:hypothetical protein